MTTLDSILERSKTAILRQQVTLESLKADVRFPILEGIGYRGKYLLKWPEPSPEGKDSE